MLRKKTISIFLIVVFCLSLIPIVYAPAIDEWITETVDEDLFFAANLFDGVDIVYLQGQEMQIRGWFFLEGPVIDARRHIIEAYLSVYTPGIGATDLNASMVIRGLRVGQGGIESYYENPSQINGPYTQSSYTVNLSAFVGPAWHNITVTNILREINQGHYFWDGHDIALCTYSDSYGSIEERYCASEESGNAAILYVHYGEPTGGPPAPDYEWVEEYRNHTLWRETVYENASMAMYWEDQNNPNDIYSGDFQALEADGTDHVFVADNTNAIEYGCENTIARIGDTIVIMEDPTQVTMHVSTDEGATFNSHILNDQFTDLAAHASSAGGSMFTDENGTTHMAWLSYTDTSPAAYVGVYSNFTLFANGTLAYFDGFHEFSTNMGWQNIEVDQHGRIHLAYDVADVLYYTFRNQSGWQTPEVIRNTGDSLLEFNIDVAVHPNASRPPIVRFVYQRQWVGNEYSEQTIRESDGTLTHTLLTSNNAFRSNSAMWFGGNQSISTAHDNPGGGSAEIEYRIYDFNTMTLGGVNYVTPTNQAHHTTPDIGIDEGNDIAYFVWQNDFADDGTWARRFDLTSSTFIEAAHSLIAPMNVQVVHIVPSGLGNVSYYNWILTDANGTVVFTDNQSTCLTIECIEDLIDEDVFGYPDPEDPDPPGWDTPGAGLLTRFNFKLLIFAIGMILFMGTPVYGFAERPEGATWVVILFCMLCGVALLWSLETM